MFAPLPPLLPGVPGSHRGGEALCAGGQAAGARGGPGLGPAVRLPGRAGARQALPERQRQVLACLARRPFMHVHAVALNAGTVGCNHLGREMRVRVLAC